MLRKFIIAFLALSLFFSANACSSQSQGKIYLYGEHHGNSECLQAELELWQAYYHDEGMRHLFIEFSYYTAAYLNLWMQEDDDQILDELFRDWKNTAAHTELQYEFFKSIKETCPETVFHGTDLGHSYWSTGERYLQYLKDCGMVDSEEWTLTLEAIEQGKIYYSESDTAVYRECIMTDNFIREYESLDGESIMGIYGNTHTCPDALNYTNEIDSMAKQLTTIYGDLIVCVDLVNSLSVE